MDATSHVMIASLDSTVIGAFIAGFVALIALVVNTGMAWLQYLHNRKQAEDLQRKERRDRIRSQLDSFYGPLWHYLMTIKALFRILQSNKPREFRTLTYLLDPTQTFDVDGAQSRVELSESDKHLLSEILDVADKIELLVLERAGLIDNSVLMSDYVPDSAVTDVNSETLRNMGLLSILLTHFRVLKLAFSGDLDGEPERYEDFVYPRELDQVIQSQMESLQSELNSIQT